MTYSDTCNFVTHSNTKFMKTGENNVRRLTEEERDNGEKQNELLDHVRDLIDFFQNYPKAHLVFVSLLPSPATNDISKHVFKYVCDQMNELSKQNKEKFTFIDLRKKFMPEGMGRIDLTLFSGDLIHLSPDGAYMLAKAIRTRLVGLNKKYYS